MAELATTTLGELVLQRPTATRVLLRYGLDFCCGGGRSLAAACKRNGVDLASVVDALDAEASVPAQQRWDEVPLDALLDHILTTYHAPLHEDLPQLVAMAAKVLRVHRDKAPTLLPALHQLVCEIAGDLRFHLEKEERILFPWIRSGRQPAPAAPIAVMEHEHTQTASQLEALSELTQNFEPPNEACATWRNLYQRLKAFDLALREHVHLENHVLHPRALAQAPR